MTAQIKEYVYSLIDPTDEEWKEFEDRIKLRLIKSGEVVLKSGEVCNEIFFVTNGAMRLYYEQDGNEINTYFAFENNFICNYKSFLTREPARYCIQAIEETVSVCFDYDTVQYGFNSFYSWNKFGRIVSEQFFMLLERRVESLLFLSAEERYLDLIKTYPNIFERIPLYHIASYLGIKGPSLSRIRKRLVTRK